MKQIRSYKCIFPLAYLSNGIAFLFGLTSLFFIPTNSNTTFGTFLLVSIGASLVIQIWLFKVKKFRESQFVELKWLKKKEKITPKQLDHYCSFNYVGYSFMKLMCIIFAYVDRSGYTSLCTAIIFFFGFLILKRILNNNGLIHMPQSLIQDKDMELKRRSPYRGIDAANQLATGVTMLKSRR